MSALTSFFLNDAITCSIHVADLDDTACSYEALSYEWGDAKNTSLSIILGGVDFPVRENLWYALRHLRLEDETRILWIDAMCINQTNKKERNHQVQQMGRIYSRAHNVVAWVGIEYPDYIDLGETANFFQFLEPNHQSSLIPQEPPVKRDYTESVHQGIRHLCSDRNYWIRLWILQELILASRVVVQCGRLRFAWQGFETLLDRNYATLEIATRAPEWYRDLYLEARDTVASIPGGRVSRIWLQRKYRASSVSERPHILDISFNFSNTECQDRRDKVFGLLSLTRDCCRAAVPIDYGKSASEVCQMVLLHHFRSHRRQGARHII